MSTRATYEIDGTTFYIHHDGYQEGAAVYFWNMHKAQGAGKGGHAEAFLRGNENAELTGGHDVHGDSEFQYTLRRDRLEVRKRTTWDGPAHSQWALSWAGPWWAFVNKFGTMLANDGEPGYAALNTVAPNASEGDYPTAVATVHELRGMIERKAREYGDYAAAHPKWTGNRHHYVSEIDRLCERLTQIQEGGK